MRTMNKGSKQGVVVVEEKELVNVDDNEKMYELHIGTI